MVHGPSSPRSLRNRATSDHNGSVTDQDHHHEHHHHLTLTEHLHDLEVQERKEHEQRERALSLQSDDHNPEELNSDIEHSDHRDRAGSTTRRTRAHAFLHLHDLLEWTDPEAEKIGIPQDALQANILLCWSAVLQLLADIIIECLMLAGLIPAIQFRTGLMCLTVLSGLIAFQDLINIKSNEFEASVQSLRVSLVVECSLLLVDAQFMWFSDANGKGDLRLAYRMAFFIATSFNTGCLFYIMIMLGLTKEVFGFAQLHAFFFEDDEIPDTEKHKDGLGAPAENGHTRTSTGSVVAGRSHAATVPVIRAQQTHVARGTDGLENVLPAVLVDEPQI